MPYYTGSASDLDDLISTLGARLSASGWVINRDGPYNNGYWLSAQPPSSAARVFHWVTDVGATAPFHPPPALWLHAGSAYDSGQSSLNQPGIPPGPNNHHSGSWQAPITEYHLFVTAEYAHLVARAGNGYWRHCLAGMAAPTASNEVAYIQQCAWNLDDNRVHSWGSNYHSKPLDNGNLDGREPYPNWVWADDGAEWRKQTQNWAFGPRCRSATSEDWGNTLDQINSLFGPIADRSPNDFNGLEIFIPAPFLLETAGGSGIFQLLAWAKDVRVVNMRDVPPAAALQIGTEEWLVFPACVKNDPSILDGTPNSGYFGLAYRKSIA